MPKRLTCYSAWIHVAEEWRCLLVALFTVQNSLQYYCSRGGWGSTALLVGGSRDRSSVVSLGIFSVATDGTMYPVVDLASKNKYQDTPGGKDGRCVRVTTLPPSQCWKSRKSRALTYRIPKGRVRSVAGHLYLYLTSAVGMLWEDGCDCIPSDFRLQFSYLCDAMCCGRYRRFGRPCCHVFINYFSFWITGTFAELTSTNSVLTHDRKAAKSDSQLHHFCPSSVCLSVRTGRIFVKIWCFIFF
jgi:hypothetical protein